MSSSASPGPVPAKKKETEPAASPVLEASAFTYREAVLRPGQHNFLRSQHGIGGGEAPDASTSGTDDALREAQWRELGKREGAAESRAQFEEQLAKERAPVARALADFSRERAAYYEKIEAEAVQLALSIARKILHREALTDPLLLMGIVKVALEKIENATGAALLVHPQRAADWRKFLAACLDPKDMPEIVEDPAMPLEQCSMRTSMGAADLGVEVQLKEIEKGLTDLLAARPQTKPTEQMSKP
jgi:flagellar biosynthesis/type III secretory pathway protein FliH